MRAPNSASAPVHAILRTQQQELGLRDIHVGETHIQLGAEFVLGQFGYLIGQKLARALTVCCATFTVACACSTSK